MSLPTSTDLLTMNYSFLGQPFVNIPAKSTINLLTMDYSYLGQPFVSNGAATVTTINSGAAFLLNFI